MHKLMELSPENRPMILLGILMALLSKIMTDGPLFEIVFTCILAFIGGLLSYIGKSIARKIMNRFKSKSNEEISNQ